MLKLLAAADRMPPVLEKDSRRRLEFDDQPFRFGTVSAQGKRRVLLPPSGAVQRRPKLKLVETLFALRYDETGGPLPDFDPAWQGLTAWGTDGQPLPSMEFGLYLEDCTVEEPWLDWDWDALLEEANHFQKLVQERERVRGELRSQKAQEKVLERTSSPVATPPSYPSMPGRFPSQGSAPARPLAATGPAQMPGSRASRPAANSQAALHAAGPSGILVPSMPSYPGTTGLRPVSAGAAQAMAEDRRFGLNRPPATSQFGAGVTGSGLGEWVELAPPPFMALCKLGYPAPVSGKQSAAIPTIAHHSAIPPPSLPRHAQAKHSCHRLALGEQRSDPDTDWPAAIPKHGTMVVQAAPWPPVSSRLLPCRQP